jgi:hypothetical protein
MTRPWVALSISPSDKTQAQIFTGSGDNQRDGSRARERRCVDELTRSIAERTANKPYGRMRHNKSVRMTLHLNRGLRILPAWIFNSSSGLWLAWPERPFVELGDSALDLVYAGPQEVEFKPQPLDFGAGCCCRGLGPADHHKLLLELADI